VSSAASRASFTIECVFVLVALAANVARNGA
jgi:hypothetical protein